MIVVPFESHHMHEMALQDGQQYLSSWVTADMSRALEGPTSFTGIHDGKVLIVAGLVQQWVGRGIVWAFLDNDAGKQMFSITRAVRRFLDLHRGMRIEAAVDVEFAAGHRWVEVLGFELECKRMKRYRPDGGDCAMYVRL